MREISLRNETTVPRDMVGSDSFWDSPEVPQYIASRVIRNSVNKKMGRAANPEIDVRLAGGHSSSPHRGFPEELPSTQFHTLSSWVAAVNDDHYGY